MLHKIALTTSRPRGAPFIAMGKEVGEVTSFGEGHEQATDHQRRTDDGEENQHPKHQARNFRHPRGQQMFGGKQANGFNRVAVGINHGGGRRPQGEIDQQIHHGDGGETAEVAPMAHCVGGSARHRPRSWHFPNRHRQRAPAEQHRQGRREPTRRRAQRFGGWLGRDHQKHQDTEGKKDGHFGHRADGDHHAAEANRADVHCGGNPDEPHGQPRFAQDALRQRGQEGMQVRGVSCRHRGNRGHTDQNQIGGTLNERGLAAKRGSPIQIMSPVLGLAAANLLYTLPPSPATMAAQSRPPQIDPWSRGQANHTTQSEDSSADHCRDHHAGLCRAAPMLRLDSLVGVLGDVMGGNDHSCGEHHRSNHQIA